MRAGDDKLTIDFHAPLAYGHKGASKGKHFWDVRD